MAVAATALSLGACASISDFDRYAESVTAFKTATDKTSQAVAAHILMVREIDRTRMFSQLAETADPCDLAWVARRKKRGVPYDPQSCGFLAVEIVREGRFSREAIAARRQVFDVLNQYTTMLNAVIVSDTPARWDSAAKGLAAASVALRTTVNGVTEARDDSKLGPLQELLGDGGPLTRLISFAGQEWINYRRSQVLDAVITQAKPQIDRISMLSRRDFVFVRKREAFEADAALSGAIFAYAQAIAAAVDEPSKDALRRIALTKVSTAVVAHETKLAEIQSIGSAMDAFDDAHAALVAYAQSVKTPEDIATLEPAVKRYAAAAKDVYEAYKISLENQSDRSAPLRGE